MSRYYVNTLGSNTAPYDTPAKGANDLWTVKQYVTAQADANPDILIIANGPNDVFDESADSYPWNAGAQNSLLTTFSIKGDPSNIYRPIIKGPNTSFYVIWYNCTSITFEGLELVQEVGFGLIGFEIEGVPVDYGIADISIQNNIVRLISTGTQALKVKSGNGPIKWNTFISAHSGSAPICIDTGANPRTRQIENNTFVYNISTGTPGSAFLFSEGLGDNSTFINNIIFHPGNGSGPAGLVVSNGVGVVGTEIDYNLIHYYPTSYNLSAGHVAGPNLLETDPVFADSDNGDYSIQPNSPCIGAGKNGADIGNTAHVLSRRSMLDVGSSINVTGQDVTVTSTLDENVVKNLSSVQADTNFENSALWDRVVVKYVHSSGQSLSILHKFKNGVWTGQGLFYAEANRGAWEKQSIVLVDKLGDILNADSDIPLSEGLFVTGYYPSLSSDSSASSESSSSGAALPP